MAARSLRLKRIADELLSDRSDEHRLSAAVTELYSSCSSVTGLDESPDRAGDLGETGLPSGKAISPGDAARCVLDHGRTSKFLRGLHSAILEARRRFPGTTIEVLYAGCGPFAPLAIPLTSRFAPAEIRFTLLDVHERSLDAARRVFEAFGITAFVRDRVRCDAATYRSDAPHGIHVVVAETMQAALESEPQVAVTMNLAPQLCPGGIFVPERIAVDCCLCDPAKELATLPAEAAASHPATGRGDEDRGRTHVGRVLELTAASCRELSARGSRGEHGGAPPFPGLVLAVPEDSSGDLSLMLTTSITVFGSVGLDEGESGLTCPRILHDLGRVQAGTRIEIGYHLGERPGFRYRAL